MKKYLYNLLFILAMMLTIHSNSYAVSYTIDENFRIEYTVIDDEIYFKFILSNGYKGWMGIAFHEFMFPADTIVAWYDPAEGYIVWDAYNPRIPTLDFSPAPTPDTNEIFKNNNSKMSPSRATA